MATRNKTDKEKVKAKGGEIGHATGGQRDCNLHGCRGVRIAVRWPDGKITYPCTKGMTKHEDGSWEIN